MATNKNKDSAALFELLDKSTLKVPKSGSLKIPSWWSSKTNPAVPASHPPLSAETAGTVPLSAPKPSAARPLPKTIASDAPAPSIRPPSKPAPAPTPIPAKRPAVFAPSTYDQSSSANDTSRGAPPLWLLATGGAVALLLLIAGIIYLFSGNPPKPHIDTTPIPVSRDPASNPVPPVIDPALQNVPPPQQNNPPPPQQTNSNQPQPARVVPFDEVKRVPNAYYLYIFSADEKTANDNAQYLAAHGISTSVSPGQKYSVVVSVDGFMSLDDPKSSAFKTRVIEIGREHPAAKRARTGVYDTAYYKKIIRQ